MKVKIAFTVEIDPVIWMADNYGMPKDEVRKDVQTYVEQSVRAHLHEAGHPA